MKEYIFNQPDMISWHKEKAHVMAFSYGSLEEALNGDQSSCRLSLDGKWKFYHQYGVEELPEDFYKKAFDDRNWDVIDVPSLWQLKGYSPPYYLAFAYPPAIDVRKGKIPNIFNNKNEVGIYRRTFNMTSMAKGKYYLHFEGVKSAFNVYINGERIGYSQGSMTPAEFDITSKLTMGENQVTVEVYRYSDGTYLEDQDMWFLSGIFRTTYIYHEPAIHIRDFFMRTVFDKDYNDALLKVDIDLKHLKSALVSLKVSIHDDETYEEIFNEKIQLTSNEETKVYFEKWIKAPKKWSAEIPNLYTVIFELKGNDGDIIQYKRHRLGFRQTEIKNAQLLINGEPILLKGVNRHDFDPYEGWHVPEKRYLQDMKIMKRNNINAIRASHYPNDLRFYEYCNEYGFYVMDEADVESHGVRNKNVPGDDPKWRKAVEDRMERMVLRDRNFPCVFMWSLGNEAGHGKNFMHMKEHALNFDKTRPFHYEGDYDLSVTDVLSRMYPTIDLLEKIGKGEEVKISFLDNILNQLAADHKPIKPEWMENKPVIVCEYAHAMENSLGNFQEYMDVFEKYDKMAGGFIWDFVDQSLIRVEDRQKKFLYGGDFNEEVSHGYFCANGIVDSERNPHPSLFEVKKVYQNISVTRDKENEATFIVKNKYSFLSLDFLTLHCDLLKNGVIIDQKCYNIDNIKPGKSHAIEYPYDYYKWSNEDEYILELSFRLKEDILWASKGYEVAFEQFMLQKSRMKSISTNQEDLKALEFNEDIKIKTEKNEIKISKKNAMINAMDYGNGNILYDSCRFNFWRAYTDNDYGYGNFKPILKPILMSKKWMKASISYKIKDYQVHHLMNKVIITFDLKVYGFSDFKIEYSIFTDGKIALDMSATASKDLVRFGYQFKLNNDYEKVEWYGRGPEENYSDRKSGSKIRKHTKKIDKMPHLYMRPQENGYRCDTRTIALSTSKETISFKDTTGNHIGFSVWPFSQEQLLAKEHRHLLKYENYYTLNIDSVQRGVGGDLPGVANVHEPYLLRKNRRYHLGIVIGG